MICSVGTLLGLSLLVAVKAGVDGHDDPPQLPVTESRLCDALSSIERGQELDLVVSGVYAVGQENQVLYDPEEPICAEDVQPVTWIEFALRGSDRSSLDAILKGKRRSSVTFRGTLYGPPRLGSDDLSVPVNIAYTRRIARGYGHSFGFRTKLVVSEIVEASEVGGAIPPPNLFPRNRIPMAVREAKSPVYPERARLQGFSGDVVLRVEIGDGLAKVVEVLSGDRLLVGSALENVGSWRFDPNFKRALVSVFSFRLEDRLTGTSQESTVVMQIPDRVVITAASERW